MKDKFDKISKFPKQSYDKLRYIDTDKLGNVINSNLCSFFETGRVEMLLDKDNPLISENCEFVVVELKSTINNVLQFPGIVQIGTVVTRVGCFSIDLFQGLFQNDELIAYAESIIVQMNNQTRKSHPLSDKTKEELAKYME